MGKRRRPADDRGDDEDDPFVDHDLRAVLHHQLGDLPPRMSRAGSAKTFLAELTCVVEATRQSRDRRFRSIAALQVFFRLLVRLGADAETRAAVTDLLAGFADLERGVTPPLFGARRWRREQGQKPRPKVEEQLRQVAVESVSMLMHLKLNRDPAAQAVGKLLEAHGFPVRRSSSGGGSAKAAGASVLEWRKDYPVPDASGFPASRADLAAKLEELRGLPPTQARDAVLRALADFLVSRGYRRK